MEAKILLADDHRLLRQGLKVLLDHEAGFSVVGEADDGRSAVRLAGDLSPTVVVMDVQMPDLNGIDATRQIIAQRPATKVVGLSGHVSAQAASEMLKAGASGYVLKDAAVSELVHAIRTVLGNEVYLSPAVLTAVMADPDGGGPLAYVSTFGKLSPREREVLQLVAEGKSTKQVAMALFVSVKTVETHRRNLMEKLGIDNIADLTRFAIRNGLSAL